jgi:hypothetical protein
VVVVEKLKQKLRLVKYRNAKHRSSGGISSSTNKIAMFFSNVYLEPGRYFKITVLSNVTPYILVDVYQLSEGG